MRAYGSKGHGVHSPFVFDFITNVLREDPLYNEKFNAIERVRKTMLRSTASVQVEDLGAGSKHVSGSSRNIRDIARHALKPPRFGRFFYRLVRYYNVEAVLELGTSLGITSRYFSAAAPLYGVVTIEGSSAIASLASDSMQADGIGNVRVVVGDFSIHLDKEMSLMKGRKLVYVDGNHRYEPTINYFNTALRYAGPDDIFVFDDIHWSVEMEKAWKEIRNSKEVTCSLDLFFIGIVLFKKEFKEKLDFAIRF